MADFSSLLRGTSKQAAIVVPGELRWSYGEFQSRVEAIADQLREKGVAAGVPVLITAPYPPDYVLCALGALLAGGVAVLADPGSPAEKLAGLAKQTRAAWVLSGLDSNGGLQSAPGPGGAPLDSRAALVIFTSGSSGPPKAVVLSGDGVLANIDSILSYLPVAEAPRTAVALPLFYSYALVGQVFTTLKAQGTVVLIPPSPFATEQLGALKHGGAQGFSSVALSLRRLCEAALEIPARERPEFHYLASAGGPLDAETRALMKKAFPKARLFNQYGLTEASPRVSAVSSAEKAFEAGSCGRAIPGISISIEGDDGAPLPAGAEGHVIVRGPSVMLGYLDDAEASARVLRADGSLFTNDRGHLDADGFLYVSGRSDGVVKVAGTRVSLEEVAAHLRAACGVDVCVVGVDDAKFGTRLVAFIEGDEARLTVAKMALPELSAAARPAKVVALAPFPRTSNGKPQLEALRQQAKAMFELPGA